MNRKILFRGKRIDNGEWAYGFYTQLPKASLGATVAAGGYLCAEDVCDWIIANKNKQHPNFSNAFPLEIVECEMHEIKEDTVCQYFGIKDKNARKIFEGDIVKYTEEYEFCDYNSPILCPENGSTHFPRIRKTKEICAVVRYDTELCSIVVNPVTKESYIRKSIKDYNFKDLIVIGNIFDNPELLS